MGLMRVDNTLPRSEKTAPKTHEIIVRSLHNRMQKDAGFLVFKTTHSDIFVMIPITLVDVNAFRRIFIFSRSHKGNEMTGRCRWKEVFRQKASTGLKRCPINQVTRVLSRAQTFCITFKWIFKWRVV